MRDGLIFFRVPRTAGFGRAGIFVLRYVCARAVFADADAAKPAVIAVAIQNAPVVAKLSSIPTGVNVPTQQVGNFIQGKPFSAAGRSNHRTRGILTVGGVAQIL